MKAIEPHALWSLKQKNNHGTYLWVWPAMSVTLQRPSAQLRFKVTLSLKISFHTAGVLSGTPGTRWRQI